MMLAKEKPKFETAVANMMSIRFLCVGTCSITRGMCSIIISDPIMLSQLAAMANCRFGRERSASPDAESGVSDEMPSEAWSEDIGERGVDGANKGGDEGTDEAAGEELFAIVVSWLERMGVAPATAVRS